MSDPSYSGTYERVRKFLPKVGTFVEAGAVDGFFESNTYCLERFEGWNGLLVEPCKELFDRLKFNRPRSVHYNCALVAQINNRKPVSLIGAHAMAKVELSTADESSSSVLIGRSLSSILDEVGLSQIDFLSLDVEGFESDVLNGIDFGRHAPKVILVECLTDVDFQTISGFLLSKGYRYEEKITYRDFLFLKTSAKT
jgi:FkbM family methyltransferase